MNSNFSQAITQIIVKGKSALYLVLKKKPLPIEILEALSAEVEIRYEKFLNQKLPLLKNIKPDKSWTILWMLFDKSYDWSSKANAQRKEN